MNVAIDYSTVKWVKHELDATLKQARQALEAYVENPADESQLRFCAVHLHQVHGTLQMVELYGAALLAEEMEQVIQALLEDAVGQKPEAYELVMRAILQLPDYLERLVAGGQDLPLVLLPLLNDLRAIRGQKLLSENALFTPDLGLPLPAAARREAQTADQNVAVRKQRHAYQLALLGWFRGKDIAANLARINESLQQLQGLCAQDAAQRLWWIAGGMVTALQEGWLDTSMATKLLLGQVDRQIKRLMDEGEEGLATNPPSDLLKNLLFYVARARDGGEPVTLIKQTYRLGALLPDSEDLARAQDSMSGHNAELMRTVGVAIKEDLARVKDALDLFLRGGRKSVADLIPAGDTLTRVADTLGMLGQGALRKRMQEQAQVTADMVAGRREADESALMDIASALLYVESALDALAQGAVAVEEQIAAADTESETAAMSLPEAEFNQVRGVVADEAIRDITQAKDAILAFMENSTDFAVLEKIPALFNQIKGGLLLLNETRAAELIDAVRSYVSEHMLERRETPAENALDDLADVISSVEYYLENLREGGMFVQTIMDVAEKSLARLRGAPIPEAGQEIVQETVQETSVSVALSSPETSGLEEAPAAASEWTLGDDAVDFAESPSEPIVHDAPAEAVVDEDLAFGAADAFSLDGFGSDAIDTHADAFTLDASDTVAAEGESIELSMETDAFSGLDPESDAFMDTASGSFAESEVSEDLPASADAFSGLSGETDAFSGLAPEDAFAEPLAEDALSEPAGPDAAFSEPDAAADVFAGLMQEDSFAEADAFAATGITGNSEPVEEIELSAAPDVFALEDADAFAGGETEEIVAQAAPAPVPAAAVSEPQLAIISEDIDDEILEIFIEEADEELVKLSDTLPRWVANADDREALTEMRRSFHTLKGSGRLVGALRIGEFAWGYESMLNRFIDGTIQRSDALCALLERAAVALPELVEQIRSRGQTTQPIEQLTELAHAVSRGEAVNLAVLDGAAAPVAVEQNDVDDASAPTDTVGAETVLEADGSAGIDDLQLVAQMDQIQMDQSEAGDDLSAEAAEAVAAEAVSIAEAADAESGIDPVLYDIFCKESHEHLAAMRRFVADCEACGQECRVSDELMRALHTLHGSARMVDADAIAEVAHEIEKYGKALRNDQRPMAHDGVRLMAQAIQLIEAMLPQMREPGGVQIPYRDMVEAVARLPRATENVEHIPSAEVPQDQDELEEAAATGEDAFALAGDDVFSLDTDSGVQAAVDSHAAEEEITPATMGDVVAPDAFAADDFTVSAADDFTDAAIGVAEVEADAFADNPAEESAVAMEPAAVVAASTSATLVSGDDWVNVDYTDVDADLLEVFLEEGDEILAAIDTTLQAWIQAPDDQALTAELQRHLHTLKGGARMANLTPIGDLSHAVESLLIAVGEGQVTPSQVLFDSLLVVQDRVVHMLEAARAQQPMRAVSALIERLESLRHGIAPAETPAESAPAAEPVADAAAEPARAAQTVIPEEIEAAAVAEETQKFVGRTQQELVRVRADLLDNMVNFAGEISIYRSRLEQQVGSMRFNLSELGQTVMRLREQLRQIEIETEAQVLFRYERDGGAGDDQFDPLEMDRYSHLQQLSRSMLEGISDLVSIQGLLDNITRESETLLLQQSRVNTELQEGLMRTRMVPFSGLAPRMRRIVRQACQELGKRAELSLEGAEGEMDRTVIDRIIAPIEHMLRNAIAHGIESPDRRRAAGKRESGSLKVSLSRDGSEVVIRMSDDGAGMNIAAIRRKAKERGLITDDAEISDNDVMQFILETGFSTAEQVSQISGRGVGMDVVNSEVKQLGGSLHIDSVPGQGTTFTIRLPFTLAISQALLVQVHEEIYAIPLTGIEGIVRMTQEELARYLEDHGARFEYAGHSYPVHNLGALLGQGTPVLGQGAPKRLPVLLVRSGEHRMALQVEGLLGSRETVVKSVGPQISTVRGISGATILGDGRVVLILDLGGLLRTGGVVLHNLRAPEVEVPQSRTLNVMVVDDSITVRKVTTRLLERNGMQVVTAKDGVDAVAKLQEHIPDVMLLDIEMPRMDGFELATHVRNEPRLRGIPMIMITSRTGDKHRKRAMEIGVDRYLGKPYQESELLDTIRSLAEEKRVNG